jgi:hypothetical protein
MTVVAVAFTPAPQHQNPNQRRVRGDSAATYYRSIAVALSSVRRWNDFDLELVTDVAPPTSFANHMRTFDIGVRLVDFTHSPPAGFWPQFNASLYTLDAVAALARRSTDDPVILIDPDCLCVGSLGRLVDAVEIADFAAFPTGVPSDEVCHGLDASKAAYLHRQLDPSLSGAGIYYGGECYVFRPSRVRPILQRAETAWRFALDRNAKGEMHFATEEHLFNYALRGFTVSNLDADVKRIWTAPVYRNVSGDEFQLALWHLPSEKDRGIAALYEVLEDPSSWWYTASADEFVRRAGAAVGIPHRRPARWSYDTVGRSVRRAQHRLGRSIRVH